MSDHLIWWLLGFIPGGIIGGYLIGRLCGNEYKKTIRNLKEENESLYKQLRELKEDRFQKKEKELSVEEERLAAKEMAYKLGYKPSEETEEEPKLNYDWDNEDSNEPDEDVAESEEEEDEDDISIQIIEPEDFKQFINVRDSETLTYYQEDGVLVDELNNVIYGQQKILGDDAMDIIDDTEKDYLYIDNGFEDKIYEIVVEHNDSFYRDVVGSAILEV